MNNDLPGKHTLTIEEEMALFALFEVGMTSVEIAKTLDMPHRVVAWRRAQLGYHRVRMTWTTAMDKTLSNMRDDGCTIREIRLALGVSRTSVYERLIRTGIATRSNAEADVRQRRLMRLLDDIVEAVTSKFPGDKAAERAAWSVVGRITDHPDLALSLKAV